mgnify:CR=1 FL=1
MEIRLYNLHNNSKDIFPIESADYKREWMDNYSNSFAYRCLPLKIANECGWLIRSPINFSLEYLNDDSSLGSVKVDIEDGDGKNQIYKSYITSHFGRGVVTFSIPQIFRTPKPYCVWVRGYPNYYKENVSFLEGIVETYWLHSTYTYNIRLVEKNKVVHFQKGEPIMFFTLVNLSEINNSRVIYDSITNQPELQQAYQAWSDSRNYFNKSQRKPQDWQKDYFKGIKHDDTSEESHLTVIRTHVE